MAEENKIRTGSLFFGLLAFPVIVVMLAVILSYEADPFHVIRPAKGAGILVYAGCAILQFFGFRRMLRKSIETSPKPGGVYIVILMVMAMSAFFYFQAGKGTYNLYHCTLYIDNGAPEGIVVRVNGKDVSVPNNMHTKLVIPVGKLTLAFNGDSATYDVDRGDWIYNPGQYNWYSRKELTYSIGGGFSFDQPVREEIGSLEFFEARTSYIFEAPKSISTKNWGKTTKRVLERRPNVGRP